jgi:hypothetical protein
MRQALKSILSSDCLRRLKRRCGDQRKGRRWEVGGGDGDMDFVTLYLAIKAQQSLKAKCQQ